MNGDFEFGEWAVQPKLNAVARNGSSRHVSPKGMEVLLFLAKRQGDVVSKEDILAAVWEGTFVTDDALTRCIGELRRVFEDDARGPHVIQTIPKSGYRLVPPIRWLADDGGVQRNGEATATREEEPRGGSALQAPTVTQVASVGAEAGTSAPIGTSDSGAGGRPVVPRHRSRRVAIGAAIFAMLAGVAIGVGVTARLRPVADPPLVASAINLEPGYALAGMNSRPGGPTRTAMAISRDGSFVVYGAQKQGTAETRLFLRRLNQVRATPIAGTEGGQAPFLSPDDRWVGFVAEGQLKKVSIDGGPATVLLSSDLVPFGASWGSDDYIAFSSGFGAGLYRIRSDGGTPEILTRRLPGEFHHRLPHCLPEGKGVLLTIAALPMDVHPRVAVVDPRGRTHTVLEDAADARYVAGHLVFVQQASLMVVRFDLDRLRTVGQAIPVGVEVAQAMNTPMSTEETSAGQFAVSDSGVLVYVAGGIVPDEQHSLVWVERDGRHAGPAVPFTAPFLAARLSPDGQRIAYTVTGMQRRVEVYDVNRGAASGLIKGGYFNFAIWTPDSQRVVFGWSTNSGPPNLFTRPVDESEDAKAITSDATCSGQGPGSWSPDGNLLAFWRQFPEKTHQILILDRRSGAITPFIEGRTGEGLFHPEFSPNGQWLAYTSSESGRLEVYVRAYPQGGRWKISNEGGTEPLWARDGKRLFYRSAAGVWAVDLHGSAGLSPGTPQLLFSNADKYLSSAPGRAWDLSLDGRRFLMIRAQETKRQPVTQLMLIQNWTKELERLFNTPTQSRRPN